MSNKTADCIANCPAPWLLTNMVAPNPVRTQKSDIEYHYIPIFYGFESGERKAMTVAKYF